MKRIQIIPNIFLGLLIGSMLFWPSSLRGDEPKVFLGDKHKNLGLACDQCHRENPPKEKVPTEICLSCHGGFDKVAELTQKVTPNPHESHNGNLPCESCHHAHKASENYCSACHDFDFKVP